MINSGSNVPKYVKVYNWLENEIISGKIKVGDFLPTEESIARDFGINRMTVRQAIDELVNKNMVSRKRGYGTTLLRDRPVEYVWQFNNITSFTESMEKSGINASTKNEITEVIDASPYIASLLNLSDDKRVIYTVRIKYANNEPVSIERSYLPFVRFEKLLKMEIKESLYRVFVESFNTYLVRSQQILSSILAGEDEMELFKIKNALPCLLVESISYDSDNIPVEVLYSCFRGDRYKFKIEAGEYQYKKKQDS